MKPYLKTRLAILLTLFGLLTVSCINNLENDNMKDPDIKKEIVTKLHKGTEHFILMQGRPEQLFAIRSDEVALLVIDMQNFVCAPEKGSAFRGIVPVIDAINKMVDMSHEKDIPVIWIRHNIQSEGDSSNGGLYPMFHDQEHLRSVENKAKSTEIFEGMHLDKTRDHIAFKNRYSAFMPEPAESDLEKILQQIGIHQLIVCGMATNVCVESTIRDAMQMDYEVILVEDATDTYDPVVKASSLSGLRLLFCDLRNSESIVKELSESN